jgi:hypothetical protein
LLLSRLRDFGSLDYAQAWVPVLPQLASAKRSILGVAATMARPLSFLLSLLGLASPLLDLVQIQI